MVKALYINDCKKKLRSKKNYIFKKNSTFIEERIVVLERVLTLCVSFVKAVLKR